MVEPPKTLVQPGLKDLLLNTLRVEVVSGPDRGKQTTSPSEVLSLGTAADNSVALTDFTVSRYHLELTRRREGVQVVDLGSTNGTFLGAVRVERAIVPPGTTLKLGASTVRIDDAVERQVELHPTDRLHDLRGASPEMLRLFAEIERVARGSASVLVHGESGTGKELIAEALHASSPRTGQPFITVDCGSLPSTLLASELFGHERGSFTGADRQHIGAFEAAPATARCSSTRSARCPRPTSPRCSACSSGAASAASVAARRSRSGRGSWRRPTATCGPRSTPAGSGSTCTTAWRWWCCGCPRCASGARTSRC
jgi:hypothetical protein